MDAWRDIEADPSDPERPPLGVGERVGLALTRFPSGELRTANVGVLHPGEGIGLDFSVVPPTAWLYRAHLPEAAWQ